MKRLSEGEWKVLEVLWSGERFSLKEIVEQLSHISGWSKTTVHTYLTRMGKSGLIDIDREQKRPYSAAVTRELCAKAQRDQLVEQAYGGAGVELIFAFLKESHLSKEERERLRQLLDNMEV